MCVRVCARTSSSISSANLAVTVAGLILKSLAVLRLKFFIKSTLQHGDMNIKHMHTWCAGCGTHFGFLADLHKELLIIFHGKYELRNEADFLPYSSLQQYETLLQDDTHKVGLTHLVQFSYSHPEQGGARRGTTEHIKAVLF